MKRFIGIVILTILAAACDSGPDGPGDIAGSVRASSSALGGVVLEVVGAGIEDFSGAGGTHVLWARQENPALYRVLVIGDGGGELEFSVTVQDRGGRAPRAVVMAAVDLENRPLPVTGDLVVRFDR